MSPAPGHKPTCEYCGALDVVQQVSRTKWLCASCLDVEVQELRHELRNPAVTNEDIAW